MTRGGYSYNAESRCYEVTSNITPLEPTKQAIEEVKEVAIIDKVVESVELATEPLKGIVDTDKLNILLDNLDSVLELISKNKITSNKDAETSFRSGRNDVSSLRIDTGIYAEIKARARINYITITDVVNRALEDYLNNYL